MLHAGKGSSPLLARELEPNVLGEYDRRVTFSGALSAVVLAALAVSRAAVASPLSAEISVERSSGAEDCPEQAHLATMIDRILKDADGRGVLGPGGDVRAEVQFARTPLGYQATLRLQGAKQGERTLTDTGPTCTALGRAVSITMALVLDPGQADPTADPRPVAVAASPPPLIAPATPAFARATTGFLTITGGSALGVVGPPSAAAGLEFDLRLWRRLWLQAAGQYVAARSSPFDTGTVDVALVTARLRLCRALNRAEAIVQVAVCLAGEAGQLRGAGSGYPSSNAAKMAWFGAGGGAQVSAVLGNRWLIGAGADLIAPLRNYTFSVENRGIAYRSSAVSAMLQLSVGVKIW